MKQQNHALAFGLKNTKGEEEQIQGASENLHAAAAPMNDMGQMVLCSLLCFYAPTRQMEKKRAIQAQ
eukprot:12251979-Ditylum_brightwellii.AAC.1